MTAEQERQREADRIAVREVCNRAQTHLVHWVGSHAAYATGVRTVLETLAIEAMHLNDHPTPMQQPRAMIEVDVTERER